ncbi:Hsp20/alpha crystallin family protein [Kaarinaea lacus]
MAKAKSKEKEKKSQELKRVEPARAMNPFEEMDRVFDNFISRGWLRPFRWEYPSWGELSRSLETRMPSVDVIDRDEEVIVRAEVPGIAKDDLEVTVADNAVTIKGQTKREEKQEKGDYYRCEITRGAFSRTIALPGYVSSSGATAKFEDGVLELKLPKVEKAKRHTVKIE